MAAAKFSRDVLEMFYGLILNEENQRLRAPISPRIRGGFKIAKIISISGFVYGKCGQQRIIKTYSNFSKKQKIRF